MNRCNNVALTIIIFGGKDQPLDKKKLGMELNLYIEVIVYTVIISMYLLLCTYFMHDDYANQRQSIETITFKYSTQHQKKFVKF